MTERAAGVGLVAAVQPVTATSAVVAIGTNSTDTRTALSTARNLRRDATAISGGRGTADPGLAIDDAMAHMRVRPLAASVPTATISAAARWLSQLLADSSIVTDPPPALHPLLPCAGQRAADIATALQHHIEHSGLFYEAHLAEWVAGERTTGKLRQEPQAHLHGQAARHDGFDDQHSDAARLVRRQLAALDSGQVTWRGDLWPGLPVAVRIATDNDAPPRNVPVASGKLPAWQATIVSTLPRLGEITVRLRISGNYADLMVHTSVTDEAAALLNNSRSLANALQRAGLQLRSLSCDG